MKHGLTIDVCSVDMLQRTILNLAAATSTNTTTNTAATNITTNIIIL